MLKRLNRYIRTDILLLSALLASTILLLAYQGWLLPFDRAFYDAQLRFTPSPIADDTVILAVDNAGTRTTEEWRFPGYALEDLFEKGWFDDAGSVTLHVEMPPGEKTDYRYMVEVSDALAGIGKGEVAVYLTRIARSGRPAGFPHIPSGLASAITGWIDIFHDSDGIVRSYRLDSASPVKLADSAMPGAGSGIADTSSATSGRVSRLSGPQADQLNRYYIPFSGPGGTYRVLSHHQVAGDVRMPELLRDKHIIVNVPLPLSSRGVATPLGGHVSPMPVSEVTANILGSIRPAVFITRVDEGLYILYSVFMAILPFLIFTRSTPRGNVMITAALVVLVPLVSLLLIQYAQKWLPPAPAFLAVILSYLLWSSRRLDNAVRYLDRELGLLNKEMAGREIDLSSRLGSTFGFLEHILPLSGWYIADRLGNLKYSSGNIPGMTVASPVAGTWKSGGRQLWTSFMENQQELEVGIRWGKPGGPTADEKAFLDEVLLYPSRKSGSHNHETAEVVEKLITQVRQAIVNMRHLHQFLDDSFSQMADGVLVTNDMGKVLYSNDRASRYLRIEMETGPDHKDIIKLLQNIEIAGDRDIDMLLQYAYLQRERVTANAVNHAGQDLLLHISPLLITESGISGVIITISDISYLKAVERARNETLSFVSHDLRSPLVSILALMEMLKITDSPEESRKLLVRIEEYAKQSIDMAEEFIQLTRLEHDADIKLDTIDLVPIAMNACDMAWTLAVSGKIRLEQDIDLDHAWINGDAGLVERAIVNLLDNAIKFTPEGRVVKARLFNGDGCVHCCVEDEGEGIPENELETIFERFQRGSQEAHVERNGIGLGLALVKATLERHGGSIRVTSKEGEGSCFCLTFPRVEAVE